MFLANSKIDNIEIEQQDTDFDEINEDISKALNNMKINNQIKDECFSENLNLSFLSDKEKTDEMNQSLHNSTSNNYSINNQLETSYDSSKTISFFNHNKNGEFEKFFKLNNSNNFNNSFNFSNNNNYLLNNSFNNNIFPLYYQNNNININNSYNSPNININNSYNSPINNNINNNFQLLNNNQFQFFNNNNNNNNNIQNLNMNIQIDNFQNLNFNLNNNFYQNNIINNFNNNNIMSNNYKEKKYHKNEILDSPKNTIHLDNVLKLKDKRTTIIIRHIPNRYDLEFLMNEININFFGKYDCLYLPMDFVNNSNLGFGFINFIDPIHILLFYTEFIGKKWNYFNSGKRCQLAYAKIQGKNELLKYIYKKNGLNNSDKNRINDLLYKSFYISNDNNNNNKNKYYPLIEIPMKYFNVFKNYYPYSLCHIKNESIFIVDKYYNF